MHISRAMQLLLLLLLLLLLQRLLLLHVLLVLLQVLLKLLVVLLVECLLLLRHRPSTNQRGTRGGEHRRWRNRTDLGHRNRRFRQLRQHDVVRQVVRVRVLAMAVELVVLLEGLLVLLGHGSRRRRQGRLRWELVGLLLVLVLQLFAVRRWRLPLIILN